MFRETWFLIEKISIQLQNISDAITYTNIERERESERDRKR